jgi:phenylalanine-4-hydroxylase
MIETRDTVVKDPIAAHAASGATTVSRAEPEGAAIPATYGASDRPPRGDYTRAGSDYVCDQNWSAYTAAEHDRYRRLYADRIARLPGLACDEFLDALAAMKAARAIPDLAEISIGLEKGTGWTLVAVPGLIPEHAFFALLAARRFPVTVWLREENEFNYIVEPDIFHDFFGHVPLLFNPMFADYMQAFGKGGTKASALGGLEYLARLYWYTVEFGLIATPSGLRIYGAGIASSGSEPAHAIRSPEPARVAFDLERLMRSEYKIDTFQATYFVIDSFAQLFEATAPDFGPIYQRLRKLPSHPAGVVLPGEKVFSGELGSRPSPG